jgi:ADP-heptose:LPS heptosyltransferase
MILLDYETDNGKRGLGDVLISTPIIQALSDKYNTKIDIVLREEAQPLLENNPYIKKIYPSTKKLAPDLHLIMGFKLENFFIARNCQPRVDSMAELFGVEVTDKLPQIYYPHQDIIPNTIGVSIESESDVRRWRHDYLLELINTTDHEWHVFGLNYLAFPDKVHNHLGKLSLAETITEVGKMERFITVDSFFSHLAVAWDIPSIIMYTTIPAEWRAEYYENAQVIQSPAICSPCMDRQVSIEKCLEGCERICVDAITPDMVQVLL